MFVVLTAVALALAAGTARAGTPSVDGNVNANVALDGQVKVDIEGLSQVVGQIDGDVARLLKTAQSQTRDDIVALLRQTQGAINDQLAQIQSASVQSINLVATRVDAQLKAVLSQAQALAAATASMVTQVERAVAGQIEGIERAVFAQLQQLHSDVLDTLKVLKSYIDEQLDRLYVRTDNAAASVAFQSRAFVDNAVLVIVRGILAGLAVLLLLRVVRQSTDAIRKHEGLSADPIIGAGLLVGAIALLASKPLLDGALGIPTAMVPPDPCASAVTDYRKFFSDKDLGLPPETTRFEGLTVQEELQRCAYLSVSSDRVDGAEQLMSGVRAALSGLPDSVGALAKK